MVDENIICSPPVWVCIKFRFALVAIYTANFNRFLRFFEQTKNYLELRLFGINGVISTACDVIATFDGAQWNSVGRSMYSLCLTVIAMAF